MDLLDRISLGAVAVLAVGSVVLMAGHRGERATEGPRGQLNAPVVQAQGHEEVGARLPVIRNLIEAGNLAQAESMVRELKQRYPYEAELSMLLGDVLMRKQQSVAAMHQYKEAIELNPDYLDKKTPAFQGKKLKVAVGEAQAEVEKQLRERPADESLKQERKMIYYLYRKIAGSCG